MCQRSELINASNVLRAAQRDQFLAEPTGESPRIGVLKFSAHLVRSLAITTLKHERFLDVAATLIDDQTEFRACSREVN